MKSIYDTTRTKVVKASRMKKRINCLLRKCKTLGRSSSYTSLRSKSARDYEEIFVGSSRRRYVISSDHLNHPLLSALIDRSTSEAVVKCEVVLFDHLLWMLQNADPNIGSDSLQELAELYIY